MRRSFPCWSTPTSGRRSTGSPRRRLRRAAADRENHRSQLRFGDGALIVADLRRDRRPPRQGEVTHSVMVRVNDAHAHCEQARAHGARILMEPTDFEYGERQYEAEDPFGHQWTFTETLSDVAPEEWGGETVAP